jgi:DNA replication protein DnaC
VHKDIKRYLVVEKNGSEVAIDNPEYMKKIQQGRYEYFLKTSGIPLIYHDITFKDCMASKDDDVIKKIQYYAEHCHEDKFKHVSLFLWGPQSTKKTSLLCNIGKQAIKNGLKVKFILAGKLIDKLIKTSGYNCNKDLEAEINEFHEQDMLLVDDILDIQKNITWSNSKHLITSEWDNFLRDALSKGQRIVFTSNNSLESAKELFSESLYELLDRNVEILSLVGSVKHKRKLNVKSVFEGI